MPVRDFEVSEVQVRVDSDSLAESVTVPGPARRRVLGVSESLSSPPLRLLSLPRSHESESLSVVVFVVLLLRFDDLKHWHL